MDLELKPWNVPATMKGAIGLAVRHRQSSESPHRFSNWEERDPPTGAGNFLPSRDMLT